MLIRIGYELQFELASPTPLLLMLYVHPSQAHVLTRHETLKVEPQLPVQDFVDCFGNRAARISAPAGKLRLFYDNIVNDSGEHEARIDGAKLHPVEELPNECLQFLM